MTTHRSTAKRDGETGVVRESAFSEEQNARAYSDGVGASYWHLARKHIIRRKLMSYALDARVLDIGCGTGDVVDALRTSGIDCYGAEVSTADVPARLSQYVYSPADALTLPEAFRGSVGAIMLLDVLEHLPHPTEMLRSIVDTFPNVSTAVVTLPARSELWSNFDDYYGHYCRYDVESARELLEEGGFSIAESGYFFHALYWPMRFTVRAGAPRALDVKVPRFPMLHRALAHVLEWDERVFPTQWWGTSLMVVARPKRA